MMIEHCKLDKTDFYMQRISNFLIKLCTIDSRFDLEEQSRTISETINTLHPDWNANVIQAQTVDGECTYAFLIIKSEHFVWRVDIKQEPTLYIELVQK
jgi:hypothetical protein